MKQIGMNRKIDALGRIVIPKELRSFFCIEAGERLEILATEDGILLRKPAYEVVKKQ
ncbi:MAG: hypothetical protein E7585_00815 [Ruminococcaceae bacterium]|nr:hypothetical protein [Oscillospiraceae bacterium]